MMANLGKRPFLLACTLVLLAFGLMACGSQPSPEEGAKPKAAPTPAAPAAGAGTPKTAEDYVRQGKEALGAKQYDQAIGSFSEALKLDPQSIQAYNNRGIAYCSKGELDRAIGDFSRVIERDPNHGKAYNNRAVAYFMKGDLDKARQDVEKAQSLGIPVNKMLTDSLDKGKAKGAPAPGPPPQGLSPTPVKPGAPGKPEAKGKPEPPGKEKAEKK